MGSRGLERLNDRLKPSEWLNSRAGNSILVCVKCCLLPCSECLEMDVSPAGAKRAGEAEKAQMQKQDKFL